MTGERQQRGISAARLALFASAGFVMVKVVTGLLGHSYALVADGVESSLDILSSLIVWRALAVSGREADDRYHFGYAKAESLAGAAVALLLMVAAVGISIQAVREIMAPRHVPEAYTLVVLVGVIVAKEALYRRMMAVGTAIDSAAVMADAWHHRTDAITSLAAFIGILVARVGGEAWAPADDVAALVASAIIAINGVRLLRPAVQDLMDRAPPRRILDQVEGTARAVPGVRAVEKIQARRAGAGYYVALHIEADATMALADAHLLGHDVKDAILEDLPTVLDVLVHMEPHAR
jgi:cation diffusion facilitator family transporter